jgi:L-lysine exporter family protein LysE/ArgO
MQSAAISGFLLGFSLILAIGAQNAFVLRQGLRQEHVGTVVLACVLSDVVLIAAGVAGFAALSKALPWLDTAMRLGGAAFLIVYGALRFRAALRGGEALMPAASAPASRGRVLATCLLLTWANPHVYLDTLVLVGSVSAHHAPHAAIFGAGAAAASVAFFTALGYGARVLSPLFARPRAWVVLEMVVGVTMWTIAATLVLRG